MFDVLDFFSMSFCEKKEKLLIRNKKDRIVTGGVL